MPPMRKHGAVIMKQEKLRLKHIVMNGERINHDWRYNYANSYIYSVTLINFSRADIR